MKNAIRILLYLLLALLVVAISVIIYKRSKTPVDDVPASAEMADSLFMDQNNGNQTALNSEDSMILDLTGQLPTQVGAPARTSDAEVKAPETKPSEVKPVENKPTETGKSQTGPVSKTTPSVTNIDYSEPIGPMEPTAAVNTNPKAQKLAYNAVHANPLPATAKPASEHKMESGKSETKASSTKTTAVKATAVKASAAKSSGKTSGSKSGTFYVVSGSFIVPAHADEQVKKLKKLGYKSASRKVFGTSEYYCAIAGKFNSRSEAEKTVHKLTSKGVNAFLKVN